MSYNEKRVQTKGHSIPFPKNTQKGKASRVSSNKNNKNTINKVISEIIMKNLFIKIMMKLRRLISYRQKLRKHI